MTTILEVQDAFEVDLGDVIVIEEAVGGGRDGEEDGRRGEEQKSAEVGLNRGAGGEHSSWREGQILGCVSHLLSLCRLATGEYLLRRAVSMMVPRPHRRGSEAGLP